MSYLEQLIVGIGADTDPLEDGLSRAVSRVERAEKRIQKHTTGIERAFDGAAKHATRLAGTLVSAYAAREVTKYADAYKVLENQLKVAADGVDDVSSSMNALFAIAQKTRAPLDATVTLYQRASMAAGELGASQEQLFSLTENVGKALAIQGGSAASAAGALLQLSQALGAGIVRAEEFNSLLDGAFPVAQAAARGIDAAGGSVAKLRQLVADGEITSKSFFEAILSQSEELERQFASTTSTIEQSFTKLENALTIAVGESKSLKAATNALAAGIIAIAENLDVVSDAALGVGALLGGRFLGNMAAARAGQLQLVTALASGNASLLSNQRMQVASAGATLRKAQADAAATKEALKLAHVQSVQASRLPRGTAATDAYRIATERLVLAQRAHKNALAQVTAASAAHTAAMAKTTFAARALLTTTTALKGALAFLGGPIGATITGLYVAMELLGEKTTLAAQAADQHREALSRLEAIQQRVRGESKELAKQAREEAQAALVAAAATIQRAQAEIVLLEAKNKARLGPLKNSEKFYSDTSRTRQEIDTLYDELEKQFDLVSKLQETLAGLDGAGVEENAIKPVIKQTNEIKKLVKQRRDYRKELEIEISQLEELAIANEKSTASYEEKQRAIEAHNEAVKEGFAAGSKEYQQIKGLILARKQLERRIEDTTSAREEEARRVEELNRQMAEEFRRPFENAFDDFEDTVKDKLRNGFKDGFSDALDLAEEFALQMANMLIFRPQVFTQGIDRVAGAILNGPATAGVPAGGLSLPFGADGLIGQGLGLTGLASSLDAFGASILPSVFADTAAAAAATNVIGPVTAAQAGAAAPLSLSSVAFPAAAIALPLILGAFGSKPHPAAGFGGYNLSSDGQFGRTDLDYKHLTQEDAQNVANSWQTLLSSLAAVSGLDLSVLNPDSPSAFSFAARVNNGRGEASFGQAQSAYADGFTNLGASVLFDPNDEADVQRAMGQIAQMAVERISELGGEVSDTLLGALDKIETEGRSAEAVLSDIAALSAYDSLGELPDIISEAEAAAAASNKAHEELVATYERLGVSVDKANAARKAEIAELDRAASQSISEAILAITDTAQLARIAEEKRHNQLIADLIAQGASEETMNQARLLHQLNMQQALQSTGGAVSDTVSQLKSLSSGWDNLLDAFAYGSYSLGTNQENLTAMEARIDTLFAAAQAGDSDAEAELQQLVPNFLDLSKSVNGANATYAAHVDKMQGIAEESLRDGNSQISLLEQQLAATTSGFDGLNATLSELMDKYGVSNDLLVSSASSTSGAFNASSYLAANPDVYAKAAASGANVTEYAKMHYENFGKREIEQGIRLPGFKHGGVITGGVPGKDSVPIMAMPGERIFSTDHSRMLENIATSARPVARDSAVVHEIRGVKEGVEKVADIMLKSGALSASQQDEMISALDEMNEAARIGAHN